MLIVGQQNVAEIIVVTNLNCTKAASLAVLRALYVAVTKIYTQRSYVVRQSLLGETEHFSVNWYETCVVL